MNINSVTAKANIEQNPTENVKLIIILLLSVFAWLPIYDVNVGKVIILHGDKNDANPPPSAIKSII